MKLSNVENKSAEAQKQLRSKLRELHLVENEVEHLEVQTQLLHDRYASLSADNTELQILVSEEQESASTALASFGVYRNKIEGHRAAVLRAESEMEEEDNKELKEKSEQVRMLTQTKEELEEDLKNPNGNTMQMTMVKKIGKKKKWL